MNRDDEIPPPNIKFLQIDDGPSGDRLEADHNKSSFAAGVKLCVWFLVVAVISFLVPLLLNGLHPLGVNLGGGFVGAFIGWLVTSKENRPWGLIIGSICGAALGQALTLGYRVLVL